MEYLENSYDDDGDCDNNDEVKVLVDQICKAREAINPRKSTLSSSKQSFEAKEESKVSVFFCQLNLVPDAGSYLMLTFLLTRAGR